MYSTSITRRRRSDFDFGERTVDSGKFKFDSWEREMKCSNCGTEFSAIGDLPLEAGARTPWSNLRNFLLLFPIGFALVCISLSGSPPSNWKITIWCLTVVSVGLACSSLVSASLHKELCQHGHYQKGGTCPSCRHVNEVHLWSN